MIAKSRHFIRGVWDYLAELRRSRGLILELTRREFRGRYLGSMLGLIWAFIHPGMMMLIYWLVFQFGLKSGPVDSVPFVVWLLSGLIPWFFISEAIAGGSTTILDNRFLVKKVVFRVSLLPIVRLLTVVPVHLFFLAVIILLAWAYGYRPSAYDLQLPYYLAATLILGLSLTLLTSALVPFFRDLTQFILVVLQMLFWAMPIVWSYTNLSPLHQKMMLLNPLYYIILGYRESLIDHTWFWRHGPATIYFWTVTAFLAVLGGIVFNRLRPQFADIA